MKLTLGFCVVALVFFLSAPSQIEGTPRRDKSDAVHTYCAKATLSGRCESEEGWVKPPVEESRPGSYYHECSFWEGDGCSSGWRDGKK